MPADQPDRGDLLSLVKLANDLLSSPASYDPSALRVIAELLGDLKEKLLLDHAFGGSQEGSPEHHELVQSFGRLYQAMSRLLFKGPSDDDGSGFRLPLRPLPDGGSAGNVIEP